MACKKSPSKNAAVTLLLVVTDQAVPASTILLVLRAAGLLSVRVFSTLECYFHPPTSSTPNKSVYADASPWREDTMSQR